MKFHLLVDKNYLVFGMRLVTLQCGELNLQRKGKESKMYDAAELKGKAVVLRSDISHPNGDIGGAVFFVEDLWKNVGGKNWMDSAASGNFAAMHYSMRISANKLPSDNDVIYGHINGFGYLIHLSEVESIPDVEV